jgi:hypothetical protein
MFRDHGGGKKQAEKSHVSDSFSFHPHPAMNVFSFSFQRRFREPRHVEWDVPPAKILFCMGARGCLTGGGETILFSDPAISRPHHPASILNDGSKVNSPLIKQETT